MIASYRKDILKMLRKLWNDILGFACLCLAVFIFCSLLSYFQYDPSYNTAIDAEPQNWCGFYGANISDLLFQWVGIGAFILPLALCFFFLRIMQRKSFYYAFPAFLASSLLLSLIQPAKITIYPNALANVIFSYAPVLWVRGILISLIPIYCIWRWKPWRLIKRTVENLPTKKNLYIPADQSKKTIVSLPSLELLKDHSPQRAERKKELHIEKLQAVLEDFGVSGKVLHANPGPIVTLYEFEPSAGVKSSRIISLSDDIARSMSALSARVAVISGKNLIGIELSNIHRETVYLKELLATTEYSNFNGHLPLVLGKDISGNPVIVDLTKMPHLLVAGTTGSGKSVGINSMILSLLYRLSPDKCKMIMIDPKMLELSVYDGIPHLLTPVVTEPKKAIMALKWVVQEMETRYRLMSQVGVRHINGYNEHIIVSKKDSKPICRQVQVGFGEDNKPVLEKQMLDLSPLPFIVVLVDEMADLMLVAGKELEILVQRLAQMARAAGIHIIMATQRPSVDVITGTIKANFPTRISFQVTSKIDSRTILGEQGAEHLLGQGDMLYMASGGRITRVHGPFVTDQEIDNVVNFLRSSGDPCYVDMTVRDSEADVNSFDEHDDALYIQAVEIIRRDRKVSTSYLQRQLQIGYNRAARLVEHMEKDGLISPPNHVGKREILP